MITVTHTVAPAGEFVQVFVDGVVCRTDLFEPGEDVPSDADVVAAWQASGILLEEELDDAPNLPQDIDIMAFAAVGATHVVFLDTGDLDESHYVMRVVNANYS